MTSINSTILKLKYLCFKDYRMNFRSSICLIFLLFFQLKNQAQTIQSSNQASVYWNSGLNFESADKNFKMNLGGRILYDHAFFSQDQDLENKHGALTVTNGTEFRQVWFSNSGTLYQNIDYGICIAFESGRVGFRGVYIQLKELPVVGNLQIGQIKEPIRLEVLTSSKNILFLERAFGVDYLPIFNSGFMVYNDFLDKKISAQAGFFRNADLNQSNDIEANNGYNITARTTGLPFNKPNSFLHLGLGVSFRKPNTQNYMVSSIPEAHMTSKKYIDTGIIKDVNHVKIVNFETAFAVDSFTFQSEYLLSNVNRQSDFNSDFNLATYYSQISYCLTGEKRSYQNSLSGIAPVNPLKNFDNKKGFGAFEIAARYSTSNTQFTDDVNGIPTTMGGVQNDLTLGLNWYLNPLTKVMVNKIWADIENEGKLAVLQVRFQVAF